MTHRKALAITFTFSLAIMGLIILETQFPEKVFLYVMLIALYVALGWGVYHIMRTLSDYFDTLRTIQGEKVKFHYCDWLLYLSCGIIILVLIGAVILCTVLVCQVVPLI